MRTAILSLFALFALWATPVRAADPAKSDKFFFKDGDAVVIIGDSITEQHLYSNYVEMWTVTRFPSWKLTFRNTGIGGDTSPGGNGRFKRDVLRYKPTAMTVDFGMNDGGYGGFDEKRYEQLHEWPAGHGRPGQGGEDSRRLDHPATAGHRRPGQDGPEPATTRRWRSSPTWASRTSPRRTTACSSISSIPI